MRGTILGFDAATGTGAINDAAGGRVKFRREEWRSPGEPVPGRAVDFEIADGEAADIFLVPGGGPLDFSGGDPARSAMNWGIVSLICALLSYGVPHIAIITLPVSIVFGVKGKNLGRDLPDRTAYYLSVAGLVLSAIMLTIVILTLTACAGLIGLIGLSGIAINGW